MHIKQDLGTVKNVAAYTCRHSDLTLVQKVCIFDVVHAMADITGVKTDDQNLLVSTLIESMKWANAHPTTYNEKYEEKFASNYIPLPLRDKVLRRS